VCAAVALLSIWATPSCAEDGPSIVCRTDPASRGFGSILVEGLPRALLSGFEGLPPRDREWTRIMAVYTEPRAPDQPAVLGSYEFDGASLRFTPRFAFRPGMEYTARLTLDSGETTSTTCRVPVRARGETRVETFHPSDAAVPENLLRVYVTFSAPMRPDDVHEHVHLYDEAGGPIALAFVEVRSGLWDPSGTRLTLFLHPGRIKQGVAPNQQMGTVLRAGKTFRLAIDSALRDAWGDPLAEGFGTQLRVVAADRKSPDPDGWRLGVPGSPGSPVGITFDEPLDRALIERMIGVRDAAGNPVEGQVTIATGERHWSFRPAAPWTPGHYSVHVDARLEDLAGNNLGRLFEEQPDQQAAAMLEEHRSDVALPFEIE